MIGGVGGNDLRGVFDDIEDAERRRQQLIEAYVAEGRDRAWAEDWVEVVPYESDHRPATPEDFERVSGTLAGFRNPLLMAQAWGREPTAADVAAHLREVLGVRLLAVIAGVRQTAEVHAWAEGTVEPPADVWRRLLDTVEVVTLVQPHDSDRTIQAWMQGLNPDLDDRSPALMLRDGSAPEVLAAARTWIANA